MSIEVGSIHFRKAGNEAEKWIMGRPIEEEIYDFADALPVGSMLTTLINNADAVKITFPAQLVNTIVPIMTENKCISFNILLKSV